MYKGIEDYIRNLEETNTRLYDKVEKLEADKKELEHIIELYEIAASNDDKKIKEACKKECEDDLEKSFNRLFSTIQNLIKELD